MEDKNPEEIEYLKRRIAELEAEKESYILNSAAIENSGEAAFWADCSGRFVYVNDAAPELTGYSKEELLGLHVWDLNVDMQGAEGFARAESEVRAGGGRKTFYCSMRKKSGELVPCEVRAWNATVGNREYKCSLVRDISVRKAAEDRLKESEKMLHLVLDTIPSAVFWKDRDSRYLGCNKVFAGDAGLESPEDIIGRNDNNMVWAEQADLYRADDRQVIDSGNSKIGYEEPLTDIEGRLHTVETSKIPLRDSNGNIIGVLGHYSDITDRKKILEKLEASEKKYRELVDEAASIMLRWDMDGNITFFNEYAQRFFGFSEEEVLGKNVLGTIVPEQEGFTGRDLSLLMKDILENPSKYEINENENITKDGRRVWIAWRNKPYYDKDGKKSEVFSIGIDITRRHEAEIELQRHRDRLDDMVRERTERLKKLANMSAHVSKDAEDGFSGIMTTLGETMGVRVACLSEIEGESVFLKTVYLRGEGVLKDMGQCPLDITPCGSVEDTRTVNIIKDVTEAYPEAEFLKIYNAKVYLGVPCEDDKGNLHAVICLLDDAERDFSDEDTDFVQILGRRVGMEMARQKSERELRISEERYRTFVENANDAIFIADAQSGVILDANREAENLTGRKIHELKGLHQTELHPPEFRREYSEVFRLHARDENDPGAVFVYVLHKDGHHIPAEVNGRRIKIGETDIVMGIFRDVSEREKSAKKLEAQNEYMKNIMDAITQPLYVIDVNDYRVKMANRAAGFSLEGPRNKCYQLTHGIDSPCSGENHQCTIGEVIKSRKPVTVEHVHYDGQDRQRLFEITAYPVFDSKGDIREVIEYSLDVTEKRRMEDEVIKAEKLESIGLLAGGIAHDFNNVLSLILNNLDYVEKYGKNEDKALSRLLEAQGITARARGLAQQLLTFSKGGEPVKKVVDMGQLVRQSARFFLSGSAVRRRTFYPPDIWACEVDEAQMGQVFNNIFINAKQAMPEGGNISVSVKNVILKEGELPKLPAGSYVLISIEDDGPGMAPDIIARIFDPYFTTKERGTGLGLSTTYSIIKKHGGHIGVESEPGEGCVFSIYLPASRAALSEKAEVPVLEPVSRNKKVLLVEDEERLGKVVCDLMASFGYRCELALNGQSGVEMFKKERAEGRPYDAVVTDLTMPGGISGREVISRLMDIEPGVKAIVTSGYSNDPIMARYRDYGFSGVLPKPYGAEDLAKALDDLFTLDAGLQ